MGDDFLRRCAPRFRKGLDKRRVELGTPGLFSSRIEVRPRAYAASTLGSEPLSVGEVVSVSCNDGHVLALRGLCPVARFTNPPTELIDGLQASFGEAYGKVQVVHGTSSIVEIAVC